MPSLTNASILSVLLLWPVAALAQQAQPPSTSLSITAAKAPVKLGEPLVVEIAETNAIQGNLEICTDGAPDSNAGFKLSVRDTKGTPLPLTDYGRRFYFPRMVASFSCFEYAPGKGPKPVKHDVSKNFVLTQPGQYTIQATDYAANPKEASKSNIITVTVTL